jgi:multisubunit Na+/H+ antiporter MnhB subunit
MTPSIFLRTISRILFPALLCLGAFFFLRGHNAPGGGFIAGLMVAGAFIVRAVAFDVSNAQRALRLAPIHWVGLGLLCAFLSAWVAVLQGKVFMEGIWAGPIGTPVIFDAGVFMVVVGIGTWIAFELLED